MVAVAAHVVAAVLVVVSSSVAVSSPVAVWPHLVAILHVVVVAVHVEAALPSLDSFKGDGGPHRWRQFRTWWCPHTYISVVAARAVVASSLVALAPVAPCLWRTMSGRPR